MSRNRVLMELFGAKKEKVTGDWKKVCNNSCNDLCR